MAERTVLEWLWWSDSAGARAARTALAPVSALYLTMTRTRNALYDRRVLRAHKTCIPALSVGNLTAGGTGKTPVSSWLATKLQERGARPAIVMRGYGDDEPLVHARLAPTIPVVVNANRIEAIERAAAAGADVAVLDDGFQHRRAVRVADVVLVSADVPGDPVRMLPAGPLREPVASLRRASLVIVTRKAASIDDARAVAAHARAIAPGVPTAIVHLALDAVRFGDAAAPLSSIAGRRVLAIAGVGNGAAFGEQLAQAGAIVRMRAFPDHHPFVEADARSLARSIGSGEVALCTLKDFVKLGALWPREARAIGYVSQVVIVEENEDAIDTVLDLAITARLRQL